jgi:hypothetical protein
VVCPGVGVPDRLDLLDVRIVVRGQDGRPRRRGEGESLESGVVVDDVELAGRRIDEAGLDVGQVEVLSMPEAVGPVAVADRLRRDAPKGGRSHRIACRVEGHVVAATYQLLREQVDDLFGAAVCGRRNSFVGRCQLGDAHAGPLRVAEC